MLLMGHLREGRERQPRPPVAENGGDKLSHRAMHVCVCVRMSSVPEYARAWDTVRVCTLICLHLHMHVCMHMHTRTCTCECVCVCVYMSDAFKDKDEQPLSLSLVPGT
jgi:hypothetical protein